jgi:hypothetical protein
VRRIFIISALIALFALPAVALGALRAPGDGTLDVKDGTGLVQIKAKGGVIGRFYVGTLVVRDLNPDDDVDAVVTGAEGVKPVNDFVTVYTGKNIRFRFIGANFKITVRGSDIDLSAVGRGTVTLQGFTTSDSGTYSFNDKAPLPLPVFQQDFALGTLTGTTP